MIAVEVGVLPDRFLDVDGLFDGADADVDPHLQQLILVDAGGLGEAWVGWGVDGEGHGRAGREAVGALRIRHVLLDVPPRPVGVVIRPQFSGLRVEPERVRVEQALREW